MTEPTPGPVVQDEQPPSIFAIACGGCQRKNQEGVSAADIAQFLTDHADCVAASTAFQITVPAVMVSDDIEEERALSAWNRQAAREGYRMAAVPQILNPSGREAVLAGFVVPIGFRKWEGGEYVTPSSEPPAAATPPPPRMPPGGETVDDGTGPRLPQ